MQDISIKSCRVAAIKGIARWDTLCMMGAGDKRNVEAIAHTALTIEAFGIGSTYIFFFSFQVKDGSPSFEKRNKRALASNFIFKEKRKRKKKSRQQYHASISPIDWGALFFRSLFGQGSTVR